MKWNVEVFGGVRPSQEELSRAPIHSGSIEEAASGAGLVYGPVVLQTMSTGSLSMWNTPQPNGSVGALHVMENVWQIEFGQGIIDIEGCELREDGCLVHSRWEVTSVVDVDARALIEHVFGDSEAEGDGS